MFLKVHLFVIFLVPYLHKHFANSGESSTVLWSQQLVDNQSVNSSTWTISAASPLLCARECVERGDDCPAFSYEEGPRLCYLDPTLTAGYSGQVHFMRDYKALISGNMNSSQYTLLPDASSRIKVKTISGVSWQVASDTCLAENAHLARVKDVGKRDMLRQVLTNLGVYGHQFWLDGSDFPNRISFVWGDGTPITPSLFKSGEPSGKSGHDCIFATGDLSLATNKCGAKGYLFICELDG